MRYLTFLGILVLTGSVSASEIRPDPRLRANRNTYHPVIEVLKEKYGRVTDQQLEQLKQLPLEAVWGAISKRGYGSSYFAGFKSSRPEERLVGRALTIRYLPRRPDLVEATKILAQEGDWPTGFNSRAAEQARLGDVLVVDLGGEVAEGVFFGDISALGAKMAGARGAVLYGASRDLGELKRMEGFPVLTVGFDPQGARQVGVDWNVPIRVGGATVLPGDVVVADDEAVLFFPPYLVEKVIQEATEVVDKENYERDLVRQKQYQFRDVYPLNQELQEKYENELKKNRKPKNGEDARDKR